MQYAIIISKKDLAGLNIKDSLLNLFSFKETGESFEGNAVYELGNVKLYTAEKDSIHCENIDEKVDADYFVFATRHKSEKGVRSLSCHVPGNWGKAKLGGKDSKLCIAPASLLKAVFLKLNELGKDLDYEVTLETVHHGPLLENKPAIFVEIGSNEQQWQDKEAGNIIAKTIIDCLTNKIPECKTAVLLGGQHYNQAANKVMLKSDLAVGHICAKYQLENLDGKMLRQAVDRTVEKVELVILDWKGLGPYKQKVKELLEKLNLESKKVKEF